MRSPIPCAVAAAMLLAAACQAAGEDKPPAPTASAQENLDLGGNVKIALVLIPAGKFLMGDPGSRQRPQPEVTISKPFYMGAFEVTQEQYAAVTGANPSRVKGPRNPVENVSWNEAVAFCKTLSARTGRAVRLPTEAEWEYACRAGTSTRYCFGDDEKDLKDYAWAVIAGEGPKGTQPVGLKKPNQFRLYDMHGNVWEWCSDWFADPSAAAAAQDPQGPPTGTDRVLRGGGWNGAAFYSRAAARTKHTPDFRSDHFGLRIVVEHAPPPPTPVEKPVGK